MEKYLFEKEWKEAVLIRKDNKSTVLVLDGEEQEVYCPEIARGNIDEKGSPCLISESRGSGNGKYEVMAFSLDRMERQNKDWICLRPDIFEDAVSFFIANHQMEEMVSECGVGKGKTGRGDVEVDFFAGDAYIGINVPDAILNAVDGGWMQIKSLLLTAEKITKYKNVLDHLRDTGKRMIFLTVFQHGLNDNMQGLLCKELSRFFGMDMDEKKEFWIVDMKLEPEGITMLSYQSITDKVLLS